MRRWRLRCLVAPLLWPTRALLLAALAQMWFGHKTFLPAFTLEDVPLDGEFSYDYGNGFWDTTAGPLMKQVRC